MVEALVIQRRTRALTLDSDERTALRDKDGKSSRWETIGGRAFQTWPRSSGMPSATCVAESTTKFSGSLPEIGHRGTQLFRLVKRTAEAKSVFIALCQP